MSKSTKKKIKPKGPDGKTIKTPPRMHSPTTPGPGRPEDFSEPWEVTDLDLAFPANVRHLMPAHTAIGPRVEIQPWTQLFADIFYFGVDNLELVCKPGIDKMKALRHIKTIMGSFEPKHEHKEAAVVWLMATWFESATWTRKERAAS